jgi:hypothetical protein
MPEGQEWKFFLTIQPMKIQVACFRLDWVLSHGHSVLFWVFEKPQTRFNLVLKTVRNAQARKPPAFVQRGMLSRRPGRTTRT